MRLIETDLNSNLNISSATEVGSYTADAARRISVAVLADQVAGTGGDYTAYLTRQLAGSGSAYRMIPITTANAASGVTAICLVTIPVDVNTGDVLKVYLDGLAGDTTTPDVRVEFWEDDSLRPTTAGQHNVDVNASGGVEVSSLQDNAITAAAIATDAIDADAIAANAVAEIAAGITIDCSEISVTLGQTPSQIADLLNNGGHLTFYRDSKYTARLYVIGGISTDRDDFLLTFKTREKRDAAAADTESILQFGEDSGLLYINETTPVLAGIAASDGSISISNSTVGSVTTGIIDITLTAQAAALLAKMSDLVWDGKEIHVSPDNSVLKIEGTAEIRHAATRTIA